MGNPRRARLVRVAAAATLVVTLAAVAGCVRFSGGTWMIRSAATPEGWPALTPVGEVQVKPYPAYRAAFVDRDGLRTAGRDGMFMELFRHIQDNEIAMTAPVEMGYDVDRAPAPTVRSMAFVYRTRGIGDAGDDGAVRVRDLDERTYASVGVRGDYTTANFETGLVLLEQWIGANAGTWTPTGPPRYLGYNGPFVPGFMRYGEVQIPVRPAAS